MIIQGFRATAPFPRQAGQRMHGAVKDLSKDQIQAVVLYLESI